MKATVLGPLLALIIGGAAGFFAGKSTSAPADDSSTSDSRGARRSGATTGSGSQSKGSRSTRVKSAKDALALPGQNNRLQSLMDYYARLDPSEFEAEAKKLEDLPWGERFMVGYLLFSRWGEEDPTQAMAYSKQMGFAGMFVRGTVMQSWASKSPEEAAKYYTDNPNEFRTGGMMGGRRGRGGPGGGSTASVIAAEWARQDSAGAMSWAQSLEGRDQRDAVRSIVSQAAKDDPSEAVEMLSTITDEDAKKDAQNSIAREWGKKNWDDAKAWVATLPADQQADAMSRALRGLADEDPKAAASNITSIPEGEGRDDVAARIAREWGSEDAPSAAKWLMETGSADAQQEGIGRVVSSWVGQDAAAAYEFVNKQPEGDVRDSAASSYVMSNQSGDVQQNLKLAETIGNERSRNRAIGMTAASWARTDKEAATKYIDSTDAVGDEAKARIKQFTEGGGRGFGRGRRR